VQSLFANQEQVYVIKVMRIDFNIPVASNRAPGVLKPRERTLCGAHQASSLGGSSSR
jgi:hypothetical protein